MQFNAYDLHACPSVNFSKNCSRRGTGKKKREEFCASMYLVLDFSTKSGEPPNQVGAGWIAHPKSTICKRGIQTLLGLDQAGTAPMLEASKVGMQDLSGSTLITTHKKEQGNAEAGLGWAHAFAYPNLFQSMVLPPGEACLQH